jgi:hypothetical protein
VHDALVLVEGALLVDMPPPASGGPRVGGTRAGSLPPRFWDAMAEASDAGGFSGFLQKLMALPGVSAVAGFYDQLFDGLPFLDFLRAWGPILYVVLAPLLCLLISCCASFKPVNKLGNRALRRVAASVLVSKDLMNRATSPAKGKKAMGKQYSAVDLERGASPLKNVKSVRARRKPTTHLPPPRLLSSGLSGRCHAHAMPRARNASDSGVRAGRFRRFLPPPGEGWRGDTHMRSRRGSSVCAACWLTRCRLPRSQDKKLEENIKGKAGSTTKKPAGK